MKIHGPHMYKAECECASCAGWRKMESAGLDVSIDTISKEAQLLDIKARGEWARNGYRGEPEDPIMRVPCSVVSTLCDRARHHLPNASPVVEKPAAESETNKKEAKPFYDNGRWFSPDEPECAGTVVEQRGCPSVGYQYDAVNRQLKFRYRCGCSKYKVGAIAEATENELWFDCPACKKSKQVWKAKQEAAPKQEDWIRPEHGHWDIISHKGRAGVEYRKNFVDSDTIHYRYACTACGKKTEGQFREDAALHIYQCGCKTTVTVWR